MKRALLLVLLSIFCGCETPSTLPPHLQPGRVDWWDRSLGQRDGLRAYHVQVEVTEAGSKIEVNGELVTTLTNTTGEIILWADGNGTFRNNLVTVVRANPVRAGQYPQTKTFSSALQRTYVPRQLYFNLSMVPADAGKNVNINVNQQN